ncbi:hypothetical protein PENTCL1PPCAC_19013 [Pristionchus entomophagus]|uniref:C3H1-type domain-containing protein n=1 Tax=Pristionchus entomophagus TaxID=358040 RepID=A0AAV5TQT8_9BILA|nr:hypothetical protein PENTCL1PPCAC_19013 [Pristionchus entomophagus]
MCGNEPETHRKFESFNSPPILSFVYLVFPPLQQFPSRGFCGNKLEPAPIALCRCTRMVDILTKTSANEAMMKKEEMEEEFEDGELVEEGEICDDDEDVPEQKPGLLHPPTAAAQPSPPNGHRASSPRDKKPSREELMAPKNAGADSLWKSQQNHQDDGFGFADRDFRSLGSSEDRDFRWNEGPANGAGSDADFDFRDRRRRHSPSPPSHVKRQRPSPPHGPFADEGPPFMGGRGGHFGGRGGFRGRGRGGAFGRPAWMERHICKFFREGYCRDGDNCSYSHSAEDSKRRPEVCKFYLSGHCKKGLACHHLHGEFPCKAFHKGECTREPCQFSHQPLTDYTRPMFDQLMRDEQFTQRMAPMQPAVRRRVLLPGGPVPGAGAPPPVAANPAAVAAAQAAAAIVTQGLVAPPGVTPGPFPPGYVPHGSPLSDPAAALPPPSVVVPKLSTPQQPLLQQQHAAAASIPLPAHSVASVAAAAAAAAVPSSAPSAASTAAAAAAGGGGFNISMMLAQIAGTMPGGAGPSGASGSADPPSSLLTAPPSMIKQEEDLDSPESPPPASGHRHMDIPLPFAAARAAAAVEYRLRLVDREAPYSGVSSAIISNSSQQSDPRIARLLASQFDAVSSMIAAQQAAAAAPVTAAPSAPPRDPRAARPDPRRDPRTARDADTRVSWMPQMS